MSYFYQAIYLWQQKIFLNHRHGHYALGRGEKSWNPKQNVAEPDLVALYI